MRVQDRQSVAVIEPDSLANLVTNQDSSGCAAATRAAYPDGGGVHAQCADPHDGEVRKPRASCIVQYSGGTS
jgi:cellulase/cellobiase CelA1